MISATIIFQDMSHQISHISDSVFPMTAILAIKPHALFNNNQKRKKKKIKGRKAGRMEQERKGTPYCDLEFLKPSLGSTKLTVIMCN